MVANQIRNEPTLNRPIRTIVWLFARARFGFAVMPDPYFDPASGVRKADILGLKQFLDRRGDGGMRDKLDQISLLANDVEFPVSPTDWAEKSQSFLALFDQISADLLHHPIVREPKVGVSPKSAGQFPKIAARAALCDFAELFPNSKVPWYVISGTFLGLVRENDFLEHDLDIDLGIHADQVDLSATLRALDQSDAFTSTAIVEQQTLQILPDGSASVQSNPVMLKTVHTSGVHIDFFVHFEADEKLWHGSKIHRWENDLFELEEYQLGEIPVFGPSNAEHYLTENYGDWRTPRTAFSSTFDTPNLRPVRNLPSIVLALRRCVAKHEAGVEEVSDLEDLTAFASRLLG